jgi:hypothetical protein
MKVSDLRTILLRAITIPLGWLLAASVQARADGPRPQSFQPFRVEVVDDETGRGVPLVELRTVNQIRFVTDSNGIAAFDEPGLMGRKIFFHVKSHGYEFPQDGFGNRGVALETKAGGSVRIKIKRLNIAQRLYRVTGAGIYRDSVLTGASVPLIEPLLNGQVLGQDSVVSTLFDGKLFWFWGDTNRPGYPLGNFHVPGATSELPGNGGLNPATGVNLAYFVGDDGFARPTCQMPGPGPTWITGLVVLGNDQGAERMFANYVKIRPPMETYERGLVEFDRQSRSFRKRAEFSMDLATYPGEHPSGHTFLRREGQTESIYYCSPYPLVRVPADPESLARPDACEAFTCLAHGTRFEERKLDRGSDGELHYGWKKRTQLVTQQQQAKLVEEGRIKPDETLLNLRDVLTGKTVLAHGGSVCWNAFRRRFVMIAVELFGSSMLGEVWYAVGDSPLGPWVHARKIVTHDDYSFYNPKQHPVFDQQNGRVLFFEGTYTSTFAGNKDPTPRYDYNQVMYQLDLADPRLALPVAIYVVTSASSRVRLAPATAMPENRGSQEIAFFAPDRPGLASVPVRESRDGNGDQRLIVAGGADNSKSAGSAIEADPPLFYVVSAKADKPPPGTVFLYEFRQTTGPSRYYSVVSNPRPGYERAAEPIGRVWKNPGRASIP